MPETPITPFSRWILACVALLGASALSLDARAQMMNPQRMYGGKPVTASQRRRARKKFRRIYGWDQDVREAWVRRERSEGRAVL